MSQQTASTLKMALKDLAKFLASDNPVFEPPVGEQKQKEVNLIMAAVVLIRLYDGKNRRTEAKLDAAVEGVREQIGQFGDGAGSASGLTDACLTLCNVLSSENEKLCPLPTETVKLLLLALADLGFVRPPAPKFDDATKKEIFKQAISAKVIESDQQTDDSLIKLSQEHFKHEILNARAVLYSMGTQLGKAMAEKETPAP